MILFQRGRKMTELCATRMELNYAFVELPDAFVELPQVFARLPQISRMTKRPPTEAAIQTCEITVSADWQAAQ
jgi:hypothetical protein